MDLDKYMEQQEQKKLRLQTLEMKKHSLQREVEFEKKISKEKEKIKEYETELSKKGFSIKKVGHGIKIGLKKSAEGLKKQAPSVRRFAQRAVNVGDVLVGEHPKSDMGSLFSKQTTYKEPPSYFDEEAGKGEGMGLNLGRKKKKKEKVEVYF